jgi:magnesium transporter
VLIVHYAVKTDPGVEAATSVRLERKFLDPAEPIPLGAIWIDMVEPTVDEDQKVERYLGAKVPSRSDPDFAQPSESYYAENGVRYLHACVVSEAEGTPDVADVTFILGPKALVTVRYDPGEAFELFGQRLGKIATQALPPDAVAVGLINAIVDRSARALNKVGVELDSIASQVFRAKGDQSARSKVYSATLGALGREDEKISNLRESLVELERLVLFLMSEGRSADAPKPVREATKSALRDLQALEQDANFKAQKVQFLLDATLGFINLAQNDIIKLFSVLAVIFMPPTMIASIYGMNFKTMPELEWSWGYPAALVLMVVVAVGPYLFFRWRSGCEPRCPPAGWPPGFSENRLTRCLHSRGVRLRSWRENDRATGKNRFGGSRTGRRVGVRIRRERAGTSAGRQFLF